jgi:hypothetical protein
MQSGEFIANEVGTSKLFERFLSSAKVAIPKIGVQNKVQV